MTPLGILCSAKHLKVYHLSSSSVQFIFFLVTFTGIPDTKKDTGNTAASGNTDPALGEEYRLGRSQTNELALPVAQW